jgi:hypothetical protein
MAHKLRGSRTNTCYRKRGQPLRIIGHYHVFHPIAFEQCLSALFLRPPTISFVAAAMQIAVVDAAQRHSEFVTDLAAKCTRLPEPNVMGVGRTLAADNARLRAHEVSMRFIAFSNHLHERDRVLTILHRS